MRLSLPVYQHPTSVVLIDDSPSFIASLEFQMGRSHSLQCFSDPEAALGWFARMPVHGRDGLPVRVECDHQTLMPERRTLALDLDRIYRIAMDPRRFRAPSVVVVDYSMPHINGLELCRRIMDTPCKKILLTGVADEAIAVDAFNRGWIDRYLKKGDFHAHDRLDSEIAVLQREYFLDRSNGLADLLARHPFSFLSDDTCAVLVHELMARHRFVEYFLFPDPAGVLFFDAFGQATLMVIETRSGLMAHLEAMQDAGAPRELQAALAEESVVPFFWNGCDSHAIGEGWRRYCRPAQVCSGTEDYFWALFDLPGKFLDRPIHSYDEYRRG